MRVATDDDALCISALGTQIFFDTYATDGMRASLAREAMAHFSVDAIRAVLRRPLTSVIVAESNGHMHGFAQITREAAHELIAESGAMELNRLYVHARFSGRGLGRALLLRAEAMAADVGAPLLWLTAWVDNHRARAFYTRLGYVEVGSTPHVFEGESYENRLYQKRLATAVAGRAAVAPMSAAYQKSESP